MTMLRHSVAFQAALLSLLSTAAIAAPIQAQSSASIDSLTWRLVDLAPNDGIAPSVTFFPDYDSYTSVVVVDGNPSYGFEKADVNPVPWPSTSAQVGQSSDALASVSANAIKTSAIFQGGLPPIRASIPGKDFFYSRSAYVTDMGSLANGISIKLGANTGLVLGGKASLQTMVDLTSVVDSSYFTERPFAQVTLEGSAFISGGLHLKGGDIAGITGSDWRMDVAVTDSIDTFQLGAFKSEPKFQTTSGDFELSFFNATANEAQGVMKLGVMSQISASGVPEISTWLMWCLALPALAWSTRYRRV